MRLHGKYRCKKMVKKTSQKLENGHEQEYRKEYNSIERLTQEVRLQLVGAI